MFVPRSVQMKLPPKRPASQKTAEEKAKSPGHTVKSDDKTTACVETPQPSSPTRVVDDVVDTTEPRPGRGSRWTEPKITDTYLETLVCGLELIFTDYVYQHQKPKLSESLRTFDREIDGVGGYVHLSGLLENPYFDYLSPKPTQLLLSRALAEFPSTFLEQCPQNSLYIKRSRPLPPPLKDIQNPPPLENRIVYIEPHQSTLAAKPAIIHHHLKHDAAIYQKWLPVQGVWTEKGRRNYCFVLFNAGVNMAWKKGLEKWKKIWPENWIVLPHEEWRRRMDEYKALRGMENAEVREERTDEEKREKKGKRKRPQMGEDGDGHHDAAAEPFQDEDSAEVQTKIATKTKQPCRANGDAQAGEPSAESYALAMRKKQKLDHT